MARIYADQVSELAIEATYGGRPVVNVLHFVNDESALSDAAKAQDIMNNWQDHVVAGLDANYVLTGGTWRSLDRDDTNQGIITPDANKPKVGTAPGTGKPANTAYLVRKITNNRQRGQRDGRMFLAGVPQDASDEAGNVLAAFLPGIQSRMTDFLSGVNDDTFGVGGGSGLVVLNTTPASREKGPQEVDLTFRTVSALVVDDKLASQRDRMR